MKNRCYYSNEPSHIRSYQEKGIRICDAWLSDATAFDTWALANGWAEGLTIDRISNGGNYCPGNCRFVPHAINVRNSSAAKLTQEQVDSIRAVYVPRVVTARMLAEQYGVHQRTIEKILQGQRWQ